MHEQVRTIFLFIIYTYILFDGLFYNDCKILARSLANFYCQ